MPIRDPLHAVDFYFVDLIDMQIHDWLEKRIVIWYKIHKYGTSSVKTLEC